MKKLAFILTVSFICFQSPAQIVTFPYKENFDSVSTPNLPAGWTTSKNKSTAGDFWTIGTTVRSMPNCVVDTNSTKQQWLISPEFDFTGRFVDAIQYFERRTASHNSGVLLEASINSDTSFSIIIGDTIKYAGNTNYNQYLLALPEILNNQSNVRFRWRVVGNGTGSTGTIRFDDIQITVKKLIDLAVTSISIPAPAPRNGDNLTASIGITNKALAGNFSFTVQLFDSLTVIDSVSISSQTLSTNQAISVQLHYQNIGAGRHPLTAKLFLNGDEDTTNNIISTVINAGFLSRTILINEIMYAPPSGMPEWVECVNNSNDTILITGWKISDAGATKASFNSTNKKIYPRSFFIVTTDTATLKDYYSISIPLLQASFSALNNTGDATVIYDQIGSVIDSLMYNPSWGGSSGGKSLERIDTAVNSTIQTNWATSKNPLGATPGFINSVSKKTYDISVSQITIAPNFPVIGDIVTVTSTIKNAGKQQTVPCSYILYLDVNKDSILTENEIQFQIDIPSLEPKDSVKISGNISFLTQGTHWVFAKVIYSNDEDTTNNILLTIVNVGLPAQSVVINEIMYAPTGDIPEWVEFYNNSSYSISINGWKISDAGTTKSVIVNQGSSIPSQTYFVVTTDTSFYSFYSIFYPVFVTKFSALNNTTPDAVVLFDERNAVIDSVYYKPSWGGSNGQSLQRYDIFSSSTDSSNWKSNTPSAGIENVIARKDYDVELKRISSSKISNGTRIEIAVLNAGRQSANSITVNVFHDTNNDSVAQTEEILHSENINAILPMDSVVIDYDWIHSYQGTQTIIISLQFAQDQQLLNNLAIEAVINNYSSQSIVINEIMYEPFSGNAEFVELLNRSADTIDVVDWKLMDQPSASGSRALIRLASQSTRIPPTEFILIASDSSLFAQFPTLVQKTVVINSSLSLNNSGEDIVLVDLTNTEIDSLRYSPSWHLKNITTVGRSLERINPLSSSNDSRNWSSSTAKTGASPAEKNSIFITTINHTSSLSLSPNPFSPDNDGWQDFLSINYTLPNNSSTIRIRIYDVTGRLIRRLAQNELSPSQGSITWNGLDDDGNRVRIGMYIVLFEALDNFGGVTKTMKDVAVVARKL